MVQCPTCGKQFVSQTAERERETDSGEIIPPGPSRPMDKPPPLPSSSVEPPSPSPTSSTSPSSHSTPGTQWQYCPYCASEIVRGCERCPKCGEEFYEHDDHPEITSAAGSWQAEGIRRDCEPHRGPVILTMGVLSVLMILGFCFAGIPNVLGLALGLGAWVMGHIDMPKIRSGQMDPRESGMTSAGWILGIIGTLINGLLSTCWGLVFLGGIMQ